VININIKNPIAVRFQRWRWQRCRCRWRATWTNSFFGIGGTAFHSVGGGAVAAITAAVAAVGLFNASKHPAAATLGPPNE
jgi:hypothetical protein